MAQIRGVVSEALQSTIRRLLPSQQGFTEDLQASNVIQPIIDLTPTAEGSVLPESLQQAQAFGSQTAFFQNTATTGDLANTAGFWRIVGEVTLFTSGTAGTRAVFNLNDGSTDIAIRNFNTNEAVSFNEIFMMSFDYVIFLRSGDKLTLTTTSNALCAGSYRQIADINGNLVNPSGFSPQ